MNKKNIRINNYNIYLSIVEYMDLKQVRKHELYKKFSNLNYQVFNKYFNRLVEKEIIKPHIRRDSTVPVYYLSKVGWRWRDMAREVLIDFEG